jgi:hypothetical protein
VQRTRDSVVHSIYDVVSDTIEIDVVTHGNVLLRYHGHETMSRFLDTGLLSIVVHVGDCHRFILRPSWCRALIWGP